MLKEFKEFALKGNMLDLAIAVIIGGAFGKIITSLVNDIIMPPIRPAAGQASTLPTCTSSLGQTYPSLAAAQQAGAPTINYGVFLNTIIDFVIVALVHLPGGPRLQQHEETGRPPTPATKICPFCQTEIPIKAMRCPHCTSELK